MITGLEYPVGVQTANNFIADCMKQQYLKIEISTSPAVKFVYKLEKMVVAGKDTKF